MDREVVNIEEPGAIRILVCGNTGVGKSTLINEVFGAEVVSGKHITVTIAADLAKYRQQFRHASAAYTTSKTL